LRQQTITSPRPARPGHVAQSRHQPLHNCKRLARKGPVPSHANKLFPPGSPVDVSPRETHEPACVALGRLRNRCSDQTSVPHRKTEPKPPVLVICQGALSTKSGTIAPAKTGTA